MACAGPLDPKGTLYIWPFIAAEMGYVIRVQFCGGCPGVGASVEDHGLVVAHDWASFMASDEAAQGKGCCSFEAFPRPFVSVVAVWTVFRAS